MKLFDYDGPLMSVIRKLWSIVLTDILFLICSVPVITAGLSFTALYDTVGKHLRDNRGYAVQTFFGSIKENWRKALPVSAAAAAVFVIFEADIYVLKLFLANGRTIGNLYVLFRAFEVLLLIYCVFVFAQIARYENSLKQILKNALILSVRHPGASLTVCLITAFCAVVIFVMPVSVLFMPVVSTWLMTPSLDKVFSRYQS